MAVVDELILRISIKNEAKGLKDLASDLKSLSASGSSLFSGLSRAAESATSAVVNFGKQAVTKLADFRAEMASVGKTTGLTGVALDQLGKSLRNMSISDLGGAVAAEELAQIAAAAGQLGVKGKDIEAFTLSVAEISKATDIAADRTAEDMAKIANQFRDSLEKPRIYFDEFGNSLGETSKSAYQQLSNIGSAINELSNNTTASAAQLVDMTKRMAGMGASVGLTVDNVAALSATMVDAGLGVERGSTAMNKMIGELYKNTDAFADALDLNAQDLADALSKDPMKAIEMVLQGMDKMKQHEGPKALLLAVEELLGKGDGITQLALNLSSKYADLGKNTLMAADAFAKGTSAHDEFLAQTAHTAARWDALKEKVNEFSRRVGEVLEPMTNWVTGILNNLADMVLGNFDKMAGYAQGKIELIKGFFSDLLGPEVVASLDSGDIISVFEGIATRVQSLFVNSPFAPLIEAAGLSVEAVQRQFNILKDFILGFITSLSEGDYSGAFNWLVSGVRLAVDNASQLFQDLAAKAQEFVTGLAARFADTPLGPSIDQIGKAFSNIIDTLKVLAEWGQQLFNIIFTRENIEATIGVLVVVAGSIAEAVNLAYEGLEQLGTLLGEIFSGEISFKDLLDGLNVLAADAGKIIADVAENVWEMLTGLTDRFVVWVGEQVEKLVAKLIEPIQAAKEKVKELVDLPGQAVKKASDAVQNETVTGFFQGLTDKIIGVDQAEQQLTQSVQATHDAVNAFGVDALYQSVYPDLISALAESQQEEDRLTDSVKNTTNAVGDLGAMNPTESWNPAIDLTAQKIQTMKDQIAASAAAWTAAYNDIHTHAGSGIATAMGLGYNAVGYGNVTYHQGGAVRFHAGGLAHDEVPAILQRGEYVLSRSDVSQVRSGQSSGVFRKVSAARYHDGGPVMTESGQSGMGNTPNIIINVSGKVLDERAFQQFTRDISRELARQQRQRI